MSKPDQAQGSHSRRRDGIRLASSAVGAHLEAGERERSKRGDQRNIDRVTPPAHDHPPDAGRVVSSIEGVPPTIKVGLEPRRKVHRLRRGRDTDVGGEGSSLAHKIDPASGPDLYTNDFRSVALSTTLYFKCDPPV